MDISVNFIKGYANIIQTFSTWDLEVNLWVQITKWQIWDVIGLVYMGLSPNLVLLLSQDNVVH